ncbi:hypothetical protein ElyMa_005818000 [Elysia marginata]|uniref:Uncharacterized protein n=1 Tax=Elysia marginata TaxID=1093978 RepID=A0AAV4FW35_9GAST|nr:hypothetical protein ElyMa_005818000 [Elysia marginata]
MLLETKINVFLKVESTEVPQHYVRYASRYVRTLKISQAWEDESAHERDVTRLGTAHHGTPRVAASIARSSEVDPVVASEDCIYFIFGSLY